MKILKIDLNNPNIEFITEASKIMEKGGLVVYPTDTAYGLGGNALEPTVINKIYQAKGRDYSKPTHVIIKDWSMVTNLCYVNQEAETLFHKLLPGPLTLVLKKKPIVPDLLTANLATLGVRYPACQITKLLSQQLSFPYTTPSANRSGGQNPYSIADVERELGFKYIDLMLDAGDLPIRLPSTLVDLTQNTPVILRPGPISFDEIEKALS